jgi:undecaprenyl-diphosphatase
MLTKHYTWIPLFVLLLFLILKKLGTRQTLLLLLFVAALITFTDQVANLFKNHFHRMRPCNYPGFKGCIRIVQLRNSFSFFSAHAATSMAVATFLYSLMRRHYKYFWLLFLWPLIFGYSRIYLGLHYPSDILTGYIFGAASGFLMFKLYQFLQKKYFPPQELQHPTNG